MQEHLLYWKKFFLFDAYFKKILKKKRNEFFKIFNLNVGYDDNSKVLDVGTTEIVNDFENVFVHSYQYKSNLTCFSNQSLINLKKNYPEIKILQGNGLNTQLSDEVFDIVHSNATVEHVGNHNNQKAFFKECCRLAKKFVFIQTPNKNFPVDFHTKLPLIHLLPDNFYRKILKFLGFDFFADINNLNLLSEKTVRKILDSLEVKNYSIIKIKLLGLVSNLIIIIKK
jgi:ubiquinone/menaquinone biosynthesis C-methylase UbiE